jgi:hypothetical protein
MANTLLNELEPYLPSSSEKKQAVMMYMAVGLVLSMWKWEVSPYTHHHLKQSLGWLVFLVLTIFADLVLAVLAMVLSFFWWLAVLITIPALTIGAMWIYQAQQGKYIWESEVVNKFFLFFSWIGNWTLNLFDANHYQIIDAERYRTEEQFYAKPGKEEKDDKSDSTQTNDTAENWQNTQGENWNSAVDSLDIQNHEINNETVDTKNLDNDQQISINNQDIWIDLSGHEINESWDFKLDL